MEKITISEAALAKAISEDFKYGAWQVQCSIINASRKEARETKEK